MPKVSVIMGIYNCADTLSEAIESIINQTFKDWEVIMCDDGSLDRTLEIAQMYAQKYDNIKVYRNEKNMGLNYTLNHCLKYITGQFVARMDGDDISLPERFEKELDFLIKHPEYAIVSCNMLYFDAQGIFMTGKAKGEPSLDSIVKRTPFCHAPCMVRREAFEAVNGYSVSDKLLRVEDWHLWIKMYAKGYKGYTLEEPLYLMRDDRNAVSRRKFKYRVNESYVGHFAIQTLKLSKVNYIYTLRPLLVGLLPSALYNYLHKRRNNTKESVKK